MNVVRYIKPRSSVYFWHTPVKPIFYNFEKLDDYYIDLKPKAEYAGPFDNNGIPMLDYCGAIGIQYNPCAIAQYGLGAFSRWQKGEENYQKKFLQAVSWLVENSEYDSHGRAWWKYDFDLDAYGVKAPWFSALAQSQAISLLIRAYRFSGENKKHIEMAEAAYEAIQLPVEQGGLLRIENGNYYLEEIVAKRKTAILDGMIFSIFGLQDLYFINHSKSIKKLIDLCLDTIERILPQYHLGYWSRADLYQKHPPMISSLFYHRLHVAQLQVLYAMTGRIQFKIYADKWSTIGNKLSCRIRALINKTYFKIVHY